VRGGVGGQGQGPAESIRRVAAIGLHTPISRLIDGRGEALDRSCHALGHPSNPARSTYINKVFLNTPQYECEELGRVLGCRLFLKVETQNPVRCFKGRGTETVLSRLLAQGARSVVSASAGNLGQALAYGGRLRNMNVTVTASSAASPLKIEKMRALGANVILVEGEIEAALQEALTYANDAGAFLVEDSKNLIPVRAPQPLDSSSRTWPMRWTWCWFRWVQGLWQQGLGTPLNAEGAKSRSSVCSLTTRPR
jgi:Pyridoxal-phosphate dependent enzyme